MQNQQFKAGDVSPHWSALCLSHPFVFLLIHSLDNEPDGHANQHTAEHHAKNYSSNVSNVIAVQLSNVCCTYTKRRISTCQFYSLFLERCICISTKC